MVINIFDRGPSTSTRSEIPSGYGQLSARNASAAGLSGAAALAPRTAARGAAQILTLRQRAARARGASTSEIRLEAAAGDRKVSW